MECHGVPEYVIVNGRVCVDEGDLKAVQGYGRFVPTPVFPPYVYFMVKQREEVKYIDKNFKLDIFGPIHFQFVLHSLICYSNLDCCSEIFSVLLGSFVLLFYFYNDKKDLFKFYFLVNRRRFLTQCQVLQLRMILVASHLHPLLFRNQLWWPHRLLNPSLVLPQAKARGTFRIPPSPSVVRALMGCMNSIQVDVCLYFLHSVSFYATYSASMRIYPYSGLSKYCLFSSYYAFSLFIRVKSWV